MNHAAIVRRIAELKARLQIEMDTVTFQDGKIITGNVGAALDSMLQGKPNSLANEILDEFARNNPDTIGLCYVFHAYEPGVLAKLWADE